MSAVHAACFTRTGSELAKRICEKLGDAQAWAPRRFAGEVGLAGFDGIGDWAGRRWAEGARALVFVGACGIAVRAIAPHVTSKLSDPAVVCVDETAQWCVPLLSGHVGGANELAREIARITGACAAVSTATDVRGVFAVDEWAAHCGLAIANPQVIKRVSGALLEGEAVGLECGAGVGVDGAVPDGFVAGDMQRDPAARVHVGPEAAGQTDDRQEPPTLRLISKNVVVGVGCRRGVGPGVLLDGVHAALEAAGMDQRAVCRVASIDIKAGEPAVVKLAETLGCELETFSAQELAAQAGSFSGSAFVRSQVGVDNVCERAVACCGAAPLLPKQSRTGTTVALGLLPVRLSFEEKGQRHA